MTTHEDMIAFQSQNHDLINMDKIRTKEEYINHLEHTFAYEQIAKICNNKIVLDLGCNTGYGTFLLSKNARRIVGVDVSLKAITRAKSLYHADNLEFIHTDGKTVPIADRSFDVIVAFQILEHIVDYDLIISEIKRILIPQGICILTTPNAKIRLDPDMAPWNPFHVREFSDAELQKFLRKYFSVVKIIGLYADSTLYDIEINRLNRIRAIFKERNNNQKSLSGLIRGQFDKIIPRQFYYNCKRIYKTLEARIKKTETPFTINQEFMDRYTTNNFYYRDDKLDFALDLLAICSADQDELNKVHKQILNESNK